MSPRHYLLVLLVATVGVAFVVVPTVGISAEFQEDEEEPEGELGTEMTAFAQSSAVDAESSIDTSLWQATVNASEQPDAAVANRTEELEQRLTTLENRSEELANQPGVGASYNARASAVRAELANLQSAIDQTNETATRQGVDATAVEELRQDASNLTGPEVAERARNLTDAPRGPPDDAGSGQPDRAGEGNETGQPGHAGEGNETGQPGHAGEGNETGQPDDTGPDDDDDGSSGGPPDDTGPDDDDNDDGSSGGPPDNGPP